MSPEIILGSASAVVGALVWLIGLEWRMKNVKELLDIKVGTLQKSVDKLDQKIEKLVTALISSKDHDHAQG